MFEYLPAPLPGEGPSCYDDYLRYEEHRTGYYCLTHVDAKARYSRREILALDENRILGRGGAIAQLAVALEAEFVSYLDGLNEEQILAGLRRRTTSPAAAETNHRTELTGRFLLVALNRLARRHARRYQSAELHHLRTRELEGVEVRKKNLKQIETHV